MNRLIFALPLLLTALATNGQHELSYKDSRFQYVLSIDSVLAGDSANYNCVVRTIKILRLKDQHVIQIITPETNNPGCSLPPDQLFIIEDINFDGIDDIRMVQFIPAAPNIPYYYWVYDIRTNHFIRNKTLERITSPEFDHKRKLIFSFWRASCCDHGSSTYKYVKGRPRLIEQSEVAEDPNDSHKHVLTEKKLVNGKWKVTKSR